MNIGKKITAMDIAIFTRQMATLIDAGLPILKSLDIMGKGQSKKQMQYVLKTIKKRIESGQSFSESLNQHPQLFNELFCNLIKAGEQSGSLDVMLNRIASYKEKIESIKRKIKKALNYPLFISFIALLVCTALLTFVVPAFESLFKSFGAELPPLTRRVIDLSMILQHYWPLILGVSCITIFTLTYCLKHSTQCAHIKDMVLFKIPVIGQMIKQAAIARFTRTLAITLAAGIPIIEALRNVAGATGHSLYAKASMQITKEVSCGQPIHRAMQHTSLFPDRVIQLVAVGEESGNLEQMLTKIADFYELEVDDAIESFSQLLEPIIMSLLGILLGALIIALYLPVFKLGSVV